MGLQMKKRASFGHVKGLLSPLFCFLRLNPNLPEPSGHGGQLGRRPAWRSVALTVDAAGFVAVVGAVVDFVALLGAVDTRAVATLELIRSAREQS